MATRLISSEGLGGIDFQEGFEAIMVVVGRGAGCDNTIVLCEAPEETCGWLFGALLIAAVGRPFNVVDFIATAPRIVAPLVPAPLLCAACL